MLALHRISHLPLRLPLVRAGVAVLVAAALLLAGSALASPADEAERQLIFAEAELHKGEFTRALHSAESALRLDPTAYRAMVVKGLAYEGLGDLDLAESLLRAYCELTRKSPSEGDVGRALARIEARQEVARTQRRRGDVGREAAELPTLERLRLRRERILVYRDEKAHGRAREELSLLAGEHVGVWRVEREVEALFLGGWALSELGEDEGAIRALELYLDRAGEGAEQAAEATALLSRISGGWDAPEEAAPAPEPVPEPEPEVRATVVQIPVVETPTRESA